ncbi:Transposase protein [Popillia japonica]|uniref:Transposase protein n=1 Tax=Popillia japonica TaxID=7064 RepID=A0AAW1L9E8_POPJA
MALSPKARKLYDISANLKATTRRLFVSNATNKKRIKESNQFLEEELLSMRLLNKIPFEEGINDCLMLSLKAAVANMNPEDKMCSLIWDEMAIQPSLTYLKKGDRILGFVENVQSNLG